MTSIKHFFENLHLLEFLLGLIFSLAALFTALAFFVKKGKRIFKNMKRPVMMIYTDPATKNDFEGVKRYLKECEIFTIKDDDFVNAECIDHLDNHCVIVLAYHEEMSNWGKIFNRASNKRIPIIIYTFNDRGVDMKKVNSKEIANNYSFLTLANNKVSLTNTLFATLATHKLKKHG